MKKKELKEYMVTRLLGISGNLIVSLKELYRRIL